jgi:hypothetical protein
MAENEITDAQIDAVLTVMAEEGVALPFGACSRNYVTADSAGEERERQLAALRAADAEADAQNRDVIRRVLRSAMEAGPGHG